MVFCWAVPQGAVVAQDSCTTSPALWAGSWLYYPSGGQPSPRASAPILQLPGARGASQRNTAHARVCARARAWCQMSERAPRAPGFQIKSGSSGTKMVVSSG